jgi:Alpha-L-arabinofuranosidase B (ABFB) domain
MEDPGEDGREDRHRRPGGPAGRHRALITATETSSLAAVGYRLYIALGAAIVIVAFAGGVALILLPNHSTTTLAGKCQQNSCHQIAPRAPAIVLPVTVPSSTSAYRTTPAAIPPVTPATTAEVAPSQTAAAIPTPSLMPTQTSPSPTPTTPGLTPGSRISIQATTACCTSFYIQHTADERVVITQITQDDSATAKADATWIVQAGLARSSCVSFESADDPGEYLRHYDFELYLNPDDGTAQFAEDATFCPQPGNSGKDYSFQSVNYPYKYIRHYDYVVYIASNGGSKPWDNSRLWPDDTTWRISQPWGS